MSKGQPSLFRVLPHIVVRLPLDFLVPFIALLALWTLAERPILALLGLHWPATTEPAATPTPGWAVLQEIFSWSNLSHVGFAILTVAIYLLGIVAIYNLSVAINSRIAWRALKPALRPVARPYRPQGKLDNPFGKKPIGIVLAGGGAKGAFQAGAMKAIYRYLAERNALDNVKVIACTSVGSWNALFWLAGLI